MVAFGLLHDYGPSDGPFWSTKQFPAQPSPCTQQVMQSRSQVWANICLSVQQLSLVISHNQSVWVSQPALTEYGLQIPWHDMSWLKCSPALIIRAALKCWDECAAKLTTWLVWLRTLDWIPEDLHQPPGLATLFTYLLIYIIFLNIYISKSNNGGDLRHN